MNPPRVLLADDSPLILRMLEKELSAAGLSVVTARDGLEAVEKAFSEDVALVVLDVMMPRMNGHQACRLLKTDPLTRHLPVVILSGRDQAGEHHWGQETGADYYLTKDAEAGRIAELARRIVAEVRATPAERLPREPRASVDVLSSLNRLLDRKLFETAVLSEIGRVARNLVHFDEAFASVIALGARVVDFAVGGMAFLEEEGLEVALAQQRRLPAADLERARSWLLRAVARERGSEETGSVSFRLFPPPGDAPEEAALADFVTVPVVSGQRLAAMMFMAGGAVSGLSAENEALLHQVANQAYIVLANSRLFERARSLSMRDSLTGLFNHRHTMELLGRELARAGRYPLSLSLLMIDIDHFKSVNESLGHLAGDAVLRGVSRSLQAGLRTVDSLGRYGGEEFVAVLPHTPRESALLTAERLRKSVAETPLRVQGRELSVTVSVGLATYPSPEVGAAADILLVAGEALFRAKAGGRNQVA